MNQAAVPSRFATFRARNTVVPGDERGTAQASLPVFVTAGCYK